MMALSAPVGRCAASFGEGQSPCPSRRVWANVGRLWEALRYKASGPFGMEPRDERKSRRKPWRFCGAWAVTSARSAGGFRRRRLTLFQTTKPAVDAISRKTGEYPRR